MITYGEHASELFYASCKVALLALTFVIRLLRDMLYHTSRGLDWLYQDGITQIDRLKPPITPQRVGVADTREAPAKR